MLFFSYLQCSENFDVLLQSILHVQLDQVDRCIKQYIFLDVAKEHYADPKKLWKNERKKGKTR